MVGVVYQRTTVLVMLLVIAVALLWSKSEMILHALGQDPGISGGAARYLQMVVPALFASGCFEASKRYLMVQVCASVGEALTMDWKAWAYMHLFCRIR